MSKRIIRPTGDRVLVKVMQKTETDGGIIIVSGESDNEPREGIVVAVGSSSEIDEDGDLVELNLNEGDIVMFAKFAGNALKIDGEDHLIMREEEILAILVEER